MIRSEITTPSVLAALESAVRQLEDMSGLMADIGEVMMVRTDENFLSGRGPDGTPWAPRSQTTLDAYARRDPPEAGIGTLRLTDTMRQTVNYAAATSHVDWGVNAVQAAVMQFGAPRGSLGTASNDSPIPWGDIPARPYLGIGPEDESAILETISDWMSGLIHD